MYIYVRQVFITKQARRLWGWAQEETIASIQRAVRNREPPSLTYKAWDRRTGARGRAKRF
jgi:hypothetical protein